MGHHKMYYDLATTRVSQVRVGEAVVVRPKWLWVGPDGQVQLVRRKRQEYWCLALIGAVSV